MRNKWNKQPVPLRMQLQQDLSESWLSRKNEEQLVLQERMLRVQEEREENLVMTIDLDKMTLWARDYYIMKQKEIIEKRASQQSSTNAE
jgi:hypothetical protein